LPHTGSCDTLYSNINVSLVFPRMAQKTKFTDVWISKLKPPLSGEEHYGDAACSGLSLKLTKTGAKSFSFTYRFGQKSGRVTLGRYPDIALKDARSKVDELRAMVAQGVDPRLEKLKQKDKVEMTVALMVDRFIERYAKPKNKSWRQAANNLRLYLVPALGSRPISEVQRKDIHNILDAISRDGKKVAANRALAHIRKFFGWLVERDYLDHSPADHIKMRYREKARDKVLSDTEIAAIWKASDAMSGPYSAWVKLSLLCGQRETETASLRRSQIEDKCWNLAASDTKNQSLHLVPFSSQVQAQVEELMASLEGEYLLSTGRVGDKPINGFSKAKAQIDRLSGVTDWRWHDLRAAVATNLAKLGYDRFLIKRVLNHKDTGVTAIYDRYTYINEKREALQKWADRLDDIVS